MRENEVSRHLKTLRYSTMFWYLSPCLGTESEALMKRTSAGRSSHRPSSDVRDKLSPSKDCVTNLGVEGI